MPIHHNHPSIVSYAADFWVVCPKIFGPLVRSRYWAGAPLVFFSLPEVIILKSHIALPEASLHQSCVTIARGHCTLDSAKSQPLHKMATLLPLCLRLWYTIHFVIMVGIAAAKSRQKLMLCSTKGVYITKWWPISLEPGGTIRPTKSPWVWVSHLTLVHFLHNLY